MPDPYRWSVYLGECHVFVDGHVSHLFGTLVCAMGSVAIDVTSKAHLKSFPVALLVSHDPHGDPQCQGLRVAGTWEHLFQPVK